MIGVVLTVATAPTTAVNEHPDRPSAGFTALSCPTARACLVVDSDGRLRIPRAVW